MDWILRRERYTQEIKSSMHDGDIGTDNRVLWNSNSNYLPNFPCTVKGNGEDRESKQVRGMTFVVVEIKSQEDP